VVVVVVVVVVVAVVAVVVVVVVLVDNNRRASRKFTCIAYDHNALENYRTFHNIELHSAFQKNITLLR
jgi:type II secretory pathway pseudopilin PulG